LGIAQVAGDLKLEQFCRDELAGWLPDEHGRIATPAPTYRQVEAFLSLGQVNMSYFGWGGSVGNVLSYMKSHPDEFFPRKMFIPYALSYLEGEATRSESEKGLMNVTRRLGDFDEGASDPNFPVFVYLAGDTFKQMLEGVRQELTRRLLDRLPPVEMP
jgi:hypothetical protein